MSKHKSRLAELSACFTKEIDDWVICCCFCCIKNVCAVSTFTEFVVRVLSVNVFLVSAKEDGGPDEEKHFEKSYSRKVRWNPGKVPT